MADQLTITDVEVKEEKPDWQGKGATIYRYTVEGDDRRPEEFVVKGNQPKKVGDSVEIEDSDYGPKVKKAPRAGGGFKRSPEESKRITRQHSQGMAVQVMAILGHVLPSEQFVNLVNFFDSDVFGKQKLDTYWPGNSDVPGDTEDLPFD